MARNKSEREPLPEQFKTIDELVAFWDTHDTEDYPEAWREVQFDVRINEHKYPRIVLEPGLAQQLSQRARRLGISLNDLVNELLKEGLRHSPR